MGALEDLALRCEAATGADRELDALIHQALNPEERVLFDAGSVRERRPAAYGRLADFPVTGYNDPEGIARHVGALPVTASLDAAMTLVPEGATYDSKCAWSVNSAPSSFHARVSAPGKVCAGEAATPALALAAAALRARAAIARALNTPTKDD